MGKDARVGREGDPISWDAELLRLSAFPAEPLTPNPVPIWQSLVGSAPAQVTERPGLGHRQETGPLGPGNLIINQQPQRTDILLAARVRPTPADEPPPTGSLLVRVGSLNDVLPSFVSVAEKWLAAAAPLGRVAYGQTMIHEVDQRQRGYEELRQLLPGVEISGEGMTDVLWQVNRPRRSKVIPGLQINRLSKWNVVHIQYMEVQVAAAEINRAAVTGPGAMATRVELDINTSPEHRDPLPATELVELFHELVDLAGEIARLGDIP